MPNAAQCVVSHSKLAGYLMNFGHEKGRAKAVFFRAFGFSDNDLESLERALREHPVVNPVAEQADTGFGRKYIVTCTLRTPDARNPCVNTVWLDEGTSRPRLITAYPAA